MTQTSSAIIGHTAEPEDFQLDGWTLRRNIDCGLYEYRHAACLGEVAFFMNALESERGRANLRAAIASHRCDS